MPHNATPFGGRSLHICPPKGLDPASIPRLIFPPPYNELSKVLLLAAMLRRKPLAPTQAPVAEDLRASTPSGPPTSACRTLPWHPAIDHV